MARSAVAARSRGCSVMEFRLLRPVRHVVNSGGYVIETVVAPLDGARILYLALLQLPGGPGVIARVEAHRATRIATD